MVYENKVLLRIHDKYGFWLSVGGHIELDEDPPEAAIREVKEEVGLDIELIGDIPALSGPTPTHTYKSILAPVFMGRHTVNETHEHVVLVYFAKAKNDKVTPEKSTDVYRWFSLAELSDPQYKVIDQVQFYANKALEKLSL